MMSFEFRFFDDQFRCPEQRIIIMQRRILPQFLKSRPKLVIERPSAVASKTDSIKLGRSISISKLITINKQNRQSQQKIYKRYSIKPNHIESLEAKKAFKLHTLPVNIDKNQEKNRKSLLNSDCYQQALDNRRKTEICENNNMKQTSSQRIQCIFGINQQQMEDIQKKTIQQCEFQNYKEEININNNNSSQSSQDRPSTVDVESRNEEPSQQTTAISEIQKFLGQSFDGDIKPTYEQNEAFPLRPETKQRQLKLQSCVISYRLWEEAIRQENAFVLGHLAQCNEYILEQPNKILHEAYRRHKYLEEQLFAYADLLSISHLGATTYTPQTNIQSAEDDIDKEMRAINRQLIQGQHSIEQKSRIMRDFVMQVRQTYSTILQELISVIDEKTEQAKTFVFKVLKWQENYITRKEYLGNLKRDYGQAMFGIKQALFGLEDIYAARDSRVALEANISKINTIYLLGNSFY